MKEKSFVFFLDTPLEGKFTMWPGFYEDINEKDLEDIGKEYEKVEGFNLEELKKDSGLAKNEYIVYKKQIKKENDANI